MEPFRNLGYQLEVCNLLDITCPGITSYYLLGVIKMEPPMQQLSQLAVQSHTFEKG